MRVSLTDGRRGNKSRCDLRLAAPTRGVRWGASRGATADDCALRLSAKVLSTPAWHPGSHSLGVGGSGRDDLVDALTDGRVTFTGAFLKTLAVLDFYFAA